MALTRPILITTVTCEVLPDRRLDGLDLALPPDGILLLVEVEEALVHGTHTHTHSLFKSRKSRLRSRILRSIAVERPER